MTKTSAAPAFVPLDDDAKDVVRRLARVLWRMDVPAAKFPADDRHAKWLEEKQDYLKRANILLRQMTAESLLVTVKPESSAS